MPLSVTRVVNALLCSDEIYCPLHQSGVAVAGATNALNTRKSEAITVSLFFPPPHPTLLTPSPLPTGILYSPQFRPHQETKMAARRTQRSHGKIGDCEQSMIFSAGQFLSIRSLSSFVAHCACDSGQSGKSWICVLSEAITVDILVMLRLHLHCMPTFM